MTTAAVSTPVPAPRKRRHLVAWTAGAVGVAVAVLIAVLAASGQASSVATKSPLIGKPAPALSGSLFSGGFVNLHQLSGNWVLVNFAASWCIPCQEELPQLVRLSAWGSTRKAQVVTVEYSPGDGDSLQKLVDTKGSGWDVLNDDQAAVSWGVGGIPESYL
ncbi:MAG: TlpA family protein disulfide reductase, partial [Acidimicrobiales bacterium]